MLTGEWQQATSRPSTPPGTAAVLLAHQGLEHVHELLSSCKASSRRRSPLLNQACGAPVLGLDPRSPGGGRDDLLTRRGHSDRRTGAWAAPWACTTPSRRSPPTASRTGRQCNFGRGKIGFHVHWLAWLSVHWPASRVQAFSTHYQPLSTFVEVSRSAPRSNDDIN
jgi:hypothetical protein